MATMSGVDDLLPMDPTQPALYTVSLEWAAGTYLRQVRAVSHVDAAVAWAEALRPDEIPGIGDAAMSTLVHDLRQAEPVPVEGLVHVWCVTALVQEQLALIHLFRTAE